MAMLYVLVGVVALWVLTGLGALIWFSFVDYGSDKSNWKDR